MTETAIGERGWLGNPYTLEEHTREESIARFAETFRERVASDAEYREAVAGLAGKTLGCWCRSTDEDEPACHGDVIREVVAELDAQETTETEETTTSGTSETEVRQPAEIEGAIPTDGTLAIIAGSRRTTEHMAGSTLQNLLTGVLSTIPASVDAVISGTAAGVDEAGEEWAAARDLGIARFPAPWDETDHPDAVVREGSHGTYDAYAGFRRNRWMAEYADARGVPGFLVAILAYEDGEPSNGTASMIEIGREVLGDDAVYVVPVGDVDEEHLESEYGEVVLEG